MTTLESAQPTLLEPTWEVAHLFPPQGEWNEEDYLALTRDSKRLIELNQGYLEVLPMPTRRHQGIVAYLYHVLLVVAQQVGRAVYFAPLRLRLGPRHYREPDLLFLLSAEDPRNQDEFWHGADLVIEIVSAGGYERDFIIKRREYANARVREYWLIDPFDEICRVLKLTGQQYVEHGVFTRGHIATSALLPELHLDVNALFDTK